MGPPRRRRGGGGAKKKSRAQRGEKFKLALIWQRILSLALLEKMNRYLGLRPMTSSNSIGKWVSPLFKIHYRSYKPFLKNNVQNTCF